MTDYEKIRQWWNRRKIESADELYAALNGFCVGFAYHSGKLENPRITYHDTREIFDKDGVVSYTGDLRTLFEIRNEKLAYELFLNAFDERRAIDESLVKAFQKVLTENTYDERRWRLGERPGEYKKHEFVTGIAEVGASVEDTPLEMKELLEDLKEVPKESALTAAAFFHAKFENIHPFADGNGRTGRLVMNYLLVRLGHPPITIHEEDRKGYYDALEVWDRTLDLDPLKAYLQQQCIKTWQNKL